MPISNAPGRCARLLALAAIWAPFQAAAQADEQALAQALIRLRGEVEQLNTELDLLREEQRTTLAGLGAQRAELAAGVERRRLAARELRGKLDEQRKAQADSGLEGEALKPLLIGQIDQLKDYVAAGLPFKVEERLGELDRFAREIESGVLPPQRAVNRLWAFYEDEFRLTRENSLNRQTIVVDDWKMLAEVARLGTMALYFRTADGQVGQAVRHGGQWQWRRATGSDDSARIQALFDALRKQIRQGYFELPMLAAGGAR